MSLSYRCPRHIIEHVYQKNYNIYAFYQQTQKITLKSYEHFLFSIELYSFLVAGEGLGDVQYAAGNLYRAGADQAGDRTQ